LVCSCVRSFVYPAHFQIFLSIVAAAVAASIQRHCENEAAAAAARADVCLGAIKCCSGVGAVLVRCWCGCAVLSCKLWQDLNSLCWVMIISC
jgi:hypothetical protein